MTDKCFSAYISFKLICQAEVNGFIYETKQHIAQESKSEITRYHR